MTANLPDNFESIVSSASEWLPFQRGLLVQRLLAGLDDAMRNAPDTVDASLTARVQEAHALFQDYKGLAARAQPIASVDKRSAARVPLLASDSAFVPETSDVIAFWQRLQKEQIVSDRISLWPCMQLTDAQPPMPVAEKGQTAIRGTEKLGQIIGMLAMVGTTDYVLTEGMAINPAAGPQETLDAAPGVVLWMNSAPRNGRLHADPAGAHLILDVAHDVKDAVHAIAADAFGRGYGHKQKPKVDLRGLNLDGLFDKDKKATDIDADLDHV